MKTGLVHLYCGDGKGKTTASVGLAVRAAGSGMRVVFVQFFKNGVSGEISVLRTLSCVDVLCEERYFGRVSNMTETEKKKSCFAYTSLFRRAAELAQKRGAARGVESEEDAGRREPRIRRRGSSRRRRELIRKI